MKFIIGTIFCAFLALTHGSVAPILPAATILRAPSLNSAFIQSDRIGGSFAYRTVEGHAYQAVSPIVRTVLHPVDLSYQLNTFPVGNSYSIANTIPIAHPQFIWQQPIFTPIATIPESAEGANNNNNNNHSDDESNSDSGEGTPIDEDTVSVESA